MNRKVFFVFLGLLPLFLIILYLPFLLFKETLTFYGFPLILLYDFIAILLSFVVYRLLNNWYPKSKSLFKLLRLLKSVIISWIVFYLFYFWGFIWHLISIFISWADFIGYLFAVSIFVNFCRFILYCLLILFLLAIVVIFVLILRLDFWHDEYFVRCNTRYEKFWKILKRKRIYFYCVFLIIFNSFLVILSCFATCIEYNKYKKWLVNIESIKVNEFDLNEQKNQIISGRKQEYLDFSKIILNIKNR